MPSAPVSPPPFVAPPRRLRPIIWLIGFFAFVNVYSIQAVIPLLMSDFNATAAAAGATVGATVLAVALLSPFVGMLSDAVGRKSVLIVSILLLTLPTAAIYLADSIDAVVVLRFLQGLAIPGITVVLMAYIGEEFDGRDTARMMSAYISGAVLGGFAGRMITGHAGAWLGWRAAFVLLAALNLVGCAAALWGLPASRRFRANRHLGETLRVLGRHLCNRSLLAACAVGFCVLFSLIGCFTYVSVLLAAPPFELTTAGLANVFCVYLLGVVVTPLGGRALHRFGYRAVLMAAMVTAIGGIALTLIVSLAAVVVGLALCACGVFFAQAAAISFIAARVGEGRSLASGLYNMAYYGGGALGAGICGAAYMAGGWMATVATLVGVQLCAIAIAGFGWRQKPSAP